MTLLERFQNLNIDHDLLGLAQGGAGEGYFCTPEGAKIIGWAGVDGIHYCQVASLGEMVFAVNPTNLPGDYVHPVAKDFAQFLSLMTACGGADALEQARLWTEAQFNSFIRENRPEGETAQTLKRLETELGIFPAESPYTAIRALQAEFDYGRIPFTAEYYETVGLPRPETQPEWKVVFQGGLSPKRGKAGDEIRIGKNFCWGEELWHIPAAYFCRQGVTLDLLAEVEPTRVRTYIEKYDLLNEETHAWTEEERELIQRENPLNIDFRAVLACDGEELNNTFGCSSVWVPAHCMGEEFWSDSNAGRIVAHYGYDDTRAWAVHRISFQWAGKCHKNPRSLRLKLMRSPVEIPAEPFIAPGVGESVNIVNPADGTEYCLSVREYEEKMLDRTLFASDSEAEYPLYYHAMAYTLFPELEPNEFSVRDCGCGDSPRRKNAGGVIGVAVGVIGMMHREEGDGELRHSDGSIATPRAVCSSLHFEPVREVKWRAAFKEKRVDDMEMELL